MARRKHRVVRREPFVREASDKNNPFIKLVELKNRLMMSRVFSITQ